MTRRANSRARGLHRERLGKWVSVITRWSNASVLLRGSRLRAFALRGLVSADLDTWNGERVASPSLFHCAAYLVFVLVMEIRYAQWRTRVLHASNYDHSNRLYPLCIIQRSFSLWVGSLRSIWLTFNTARVGAS